MATTAPAPISARPRRLSVRLVVPAGRAGLNRATTVAIGRPEGYWAIFLDKRAPFGGQQRLEAPQGPVACQEYRDFSGIPEIIPDEAEQRVNGFVNALRLTPERLEREKAPPKIGAEIGHVPDTGRRRDTMKMPRILPPAARAALMSADS
jgi:hypothetical protein